MKTLNALPWMFWIASAVCPAQTLAIRLYDYSGLSADENSHATEVASLVLGHSAIRILWLHCQQDGSQCAARMKDNEIVVRLDAVQPRSGNPRIHGLGSSIVTAEGGQWSSVHVLEVRALAADLGVAFDLLLGYAVAHEAGHCLLGPRHSLAGLMRPAWTRKDTQEMSRSSLVLSKPEARRAADRLRSAALRAERD